MHVNLWLFSSFIVCVFFLFLKNSLSTQERFGRLFKWFPDFGGGALEAAVAVAAQDWFHGLMDKAATEKTLAGECVRVNSKCVLFSLCCWTCVCMRTYLRWRGALEVAVAVTV